MSIDANMIKVFNLIDFESILVDFEIDINGKYIIDSDDDKLIQSIKKYCMINENEKVIKNIVETYGIFNAIKLYQDNYEESYNIDGDTSYINTYCSLCILIVFNSLKTSCSTHTGLEKDSYIMFYDKEDTLDLYIDYTREIDNVECEKEDDEYKEIKNLIDTDNILPYYEKDINGKYKDRTFIKEYDDGCNCCCVVYNYCQTEHINIIKKIVDTYGMYNAIILYQDETGLDICDEDDFELEKIKNYDSTYRTLSTCIVYKVLHLVSFDVSCEENLQ